MYSKGKKAKARKAYSYSSDSTLSPAPANTYHESYYFEDGSFEILMKNTYYNLHKSILRRQSRLFEVAISNVKPSAFGGSSLTQTGVPGYPYRLHEGDASQEGFELLLSIIYPVAYDAKLEYTLDEWFKILEASTALQFASIRSLATKTLSELLDPFGKIQHGRDYGLDTLYLQGYKELCERTAFLSFDEGETLGLKDVIWIGQTRENLSKGGSWDDVKDIFNDVMEAPADSGEEPALAPPVEILQPDEPELAY